MNIWVAASDGNIDAVEQFLAVGVDVNAKDEYGYTPLQAAVSYGHVELLRFLLDNGASVMMPDNDMETPLHHCETVECAKILLESGAELNARNAEGRTPLDSAIEEEHDELVAYYESLGAEKTTLIIEGNEEDEEMEE
ncbi:TPA: hypothetical protein N0F65_004400 [Lagenidium giganteum]|uniref:Ankyrin n=1 Tax=Lagenidium giganteum TaxID=4803 RepID=A0AAV2ZCK8_9STRA|nr:TPA: hypothetical protein N0F65_004400 [Lagenidium giganteum]